MLQSKHYKLLVSLLLASCHFAAASGAVVTPSALGSALPSPVLVHLTPAPPVSWKRLRPILPSKPVLPSQSAPALPVTVVPSQSAPALPVTVVPSQPAAAPLLPVLNWPAGSDWINVKSDVTPVAVGDGVHDDTAALQAAMNLLTASQVKWDGGTRTDKFTIYLPAGTYRITGTLKMSNVCGALIVGQGNGTHILWDGPSGQTMYVSNGVTRSRYVGIVWDGANKASIGIDHHAVSLYETCDRHQDEAFVNFTSVGVRVGYQEIIPTSEMTYQNCLFQNCGNGVEFLSWNDLNNNFEGCEFQDNSIAVNCVEGNVYLRDCHFERSRTLDVYLCSEQHSVRRCTSVGSTQFLAVPGAGSNCNVTIQDCHIDGWTGSQGAMTFAMRGPTTIFDCSFTHPPDTKAPIRLTNYGGWTQLMIVSNNIAASSSALVDPGQNGHVTVLPAGTRGPSLSDPNRSFFKSSRSVPTSVINVQTRFGAVGDGYTDDTQAIINALNAARTQGGNVEVYLPAGVYRVSQTLPIFGSNYSVQGSGYNTVLKWLGSPTGVVFNVQDPQGVALKNLFIDTSVSTACIRQTSTGAAASSMVYERIWTGSSLLLPGDTGGGNGHVSSASPIYRGLECVGLSSTSKVQLDDFAGSLHFTDCSQSVILGDFTQGVLQVDGAQYEKTGFLGILAHNAALSPCDVIVRDNQDLVGTNFYTEQTNAALSVSGDGALLGQPGHVTIQGAKVQTYNPVSISVDNYEGRVTYTGAVLQNSVAPQVSQTGTRPIDIVLLGDSMMTGQADFTAANVTLDQGGHLSALENYSAIYANPSDPTFSVVPNSPLTDANAPAVAALDDFRQLGAFDLALNYP